MSLALVPQLGYYERVPAITPVFPIFSLAECQSQPSTELGRRVAKLLELQQIGITVPNCSILPVSFLRQLFLANKLEVKFRWLLEHVRWQDQASVETTSQELQTLIKQMYWPDPAQAIFFQHHQAWMHHAFLAIRPSFLSDQARGHFSLLNIRGEANLVESILELWASWYQPQYLAQRWREWQAGDHFPASIILQQMVPSKTSGFAQIYFSPQLHQPQATIFAGWGVTTQSQRQKKVMDEYQVNLKTGQLMNQLLNLKQLMYVHQLDHLEKKPVPYGQQAVASLESHQLTLLTSLCQKIYLQFGKSTEELLEVDWAYDGKVLYVLHIQTKPAQRLSSLPALKLPPNISALASAPTSQMKIYVFNTVATPSRPNFAETLAGWSFESSAWWLAQQTHPQTLFEQGQAEYIKHELLQALTPYFAHLQGQEVWYQPQTLTSEELRQLEFGEAHEQREKNPWLGYRGALRAIHQPANFDFELDVVSDLARKINQPVQLILPWVRSSPELALLLKHIQHAPAEQSAHLQLWLACSTPENLLNIHLYASQAIHGVVIQLEDLFNLLFGLDPTEDNVLKYYTVDLLLWRSLLKAVAKRLATFDKPMVVKTSHPTHQLLELITEVGAAGVMVPATDIRSTRQILQIPEEKD